MKSQEIPSKEKLLSIRKKHFLPTALHYHQEPIHLVRARGVHVYDEEGKEYLDGIGGIVSISAGHNHPKIKSALKTLIDEDEIQHTSLLYLSRHVTDLTEALLEEAPQGLDRASFTNSGSEANELAFMAVRNATGETTIVSLKHGYHGGTAGTLAQCGHHNWRFRSQPVVSTTQAVAPYCYRCPFGKTPGNCSLECAKDVEATIQTTTHGKIAGMIVEPVLGVGGFIAPPKEYFDEVTQIVHRYGGKFISDEVQTGVGRCGGAFFLTKELGIDADLITMAKGLGNGAAIGGVLMKTEVADPLKGKLYFNTFGGDSYQTVQARVTVEVIKEENLIENAQKMGTLLEEGLKDLMKRHPLIGDVRGRGLLLGMELVRDRKTKEYANTEAAQFMDLCKEKGLLIGKGGLFGNVIRIAPPLCIDRPQIEKIVEIFDGALYELEKQ